MRISVIIPTHNRNNYLNDAVLSVLRQTCKPLEIVIVNNGEGKVMLKHKTDFNVRIIDTIKNAGASQARNVGATFAEGEYLAFLDDDDLWNEKYLENVKAEIIKGGLCILSRLDKYANGQVSRFKNPDGKFSLENILTRNPGISGSNIVIRKKEYFEIGGFDVDLIISNDKSFGIKLLRSGIKISILKDNFAIQRMHLQERLTTHTDNRYLAIMTFIKKYRYLMTNQIYRYNMMKYYKYRYISGKPFSLMMYKFTRVKYNTVCTFGGVNYGKIKIHKS